MVKIPSLLFHFLPFLNPCIKAMLSYGQLKGFWHCRRLKGAFLSRARIQRARAQEELFTPWWSASQRLQYVPSWQAEICLDSEPSHPLRKHQHSCDSTARSTTGPCRGLSQPIRFGLQNKHLFVPRLQFNRLHTQKKKKKAVSLHSALGLDPKKYSKAENQRGNTTELYLSVSLAA